MQDSNSPGNCDISKLSQGILRVHTIADTEHHANESNISALKNDGMDQIAYRQRQNQTKARKSAPEQLFYTIAHLRITSTERKRLAPCTFAVGAYQS
jgi:hypothetical protein